MKLLTNSEVKKPYDCLEYFHQYVRFKGTSSFLLPASCSGSEILFLLWIYSNQPVLTLQMWWTLRFPWPSTPGGRATTMSQQRTRSPRRRSGRFSRTRGSGI